MFLGVQLAGPAGPFWPWILLILDRMPGNYKQSGWSNLKGEGKIQVTGFILKAQSRSTMHPKNGGNRMHLLMKNATGRRSMAAFQVGIALLFGVVILTSCDSLGPDSLARYHSEIARVDFPRLAGWEVQVEQDGGGGTAFLTMKNDYSGVLVTRAPQSMLFPGMDEDAGVGAYLERLLELGEESFTASGPVEERKKSGYRQAVVPIEMTEVADLAGASNGVMLLAMEEDQVVLALFYCAVDQLELCEKDLARSVQGFKLVKP